MLVEHLLEHIDWDVGLIQQHSVMSRARRPFQCFVRTQVDIVVERVGNIVVDEGTRERVLILITSLAGKEANVMSLLGHNHCEFDLVNIHGQQKAHQRSDISLGYSPHAVSLPLEE